MGVDNDVNELYRELGVTPDCTIEQFRQAYRRRVGSLHPDRIRTDGGLTRLQQLNGSYAWATEFHRLHGRLPGARIQIQGARTVYEPAPAVARDAPPMAGNSHRARYSVLVALVAVTLLWLHGSGSLGPRVALGMDADDIRAIQGEPARITGSRWEYGLSWIEFRCGKVVDWYSESGQPLRVHDNPVTGGKPLHPDTALDC
ncbi:J domain-containing protein [Lysobacter sp. A286]